MMTAMMPLTYLNSGEKAVVAHVGGTQDVRRHLEDLGFVPGAEITGVSATGNGNVIVAVKSTRLAISAKMAEKVFVAEGGKRK
jgi:ferrous iron transport protein A